MEPCPVCCDAALRVLFGEADAEDLSEFRGSGKNLRRQGKVPAKFGEGAVEASPYITSHPGSSELWELKQTAEARKPAPSKLRVPNTAKAVWATETHEPLP